MSDMPSGPGARPKRSVRASLESEGRVSATVLAHVRLNVVRDGVVQLGDGLGRTEAPPGQTLADVDVAGDRCRAAREVQRRLPTGLDVRRALLVERAVWALGRAAEVLRLAPAVRPRVAGEVDVPQPAAAREHLPAHEEQAA